jgi:peptidoglycan/xylan/chitin deacetylase (PgdA/CDA1 family)
VSPTLALRMLERSTTALATLAGRSSMVVARRLRAGHPGGVIVCGHTLTAEQTRVQVEVLGRWFDFIDHDDLMARLERPRSRPFCLLTFDDGKRSNATELAPELERLGVPAAFYVVTQFLSRGAPLWFDRQGALVRALGYTPPGLDLPTLKRLPLASVHERLDRACAQHNVTPDMQSDDIRPMSWDDARRMARQGFTIGAHSVSHSVLTNETERDALSDIEQSVAAVSAELGTPCSTFAFPNGNYTERLARHALHVGVQTVMTTEPVWVDGRFPPWRLPRVQLFGEHSRLKIELKLAAAATGRLLINPDGTGRDYVRRSGRRASRRLRPAAAV